MQFTASPQGDANAHPVGDVDPSGELGFFCCPIVLCAAREAAVRGEGYIIGLFGHKAECRE